jgi:hypothetical protein
MTKLTNLIFLGAMILTTCTAAEKRPEKKAISPIVIENLASKAEVKLLENEIKNLNSRLKILYSFNQKIGLFNVIDLKEAAMASDYQLIKQRSREFREDLGKKTFELTLLENELESLRLRSSKSAIAAQIEKLSASSLLVQNLQSKFTEEIDSMNGELENRFRIIFSLSIRMFLEKNKNYIALLEQSNISVPSSRSTWPLEIVDIQQEVTQLIQVNYYSADDAKNK